MGHSVKTARRPSSRASQKASGTIGKPTKKNSKTVTAVAAIVVFVILSLLVYFQSQKGSKMLSYPPERIAADALEALSAGKKEDFLKYVDIRTFASMMDSTGLTRRDYAQADAARMHELEAAHGEILAGDLFVSANTSKKYQIVAQTVEEVRAGFNIRPWIQFGNKLYKRINLEKRGQEWKITGLASPDA